MINAIESNIGLIEFENNQFTKKSSWPKTLVTTTLGHYRCFDKEYEEIAWKHSVSRDVYYMYSKLSVQNSFSFHIMFYLLVLLSQLDSLQ